jgi:uncharacterized protein YecE (DUF72 family)
VSGPFVGTSGWGYPSWQPGFYPAGLDRSEFLAYYAAQLPTVELNATKYRLPSEEQFHAWAGQVPDGFRFAVKAPDGLERRLTTFEERVRCLQPLAEDASRHLGLELKLVRFTGRVEVETIGSGRGHG